jgi:hypothetical protein
MPPIREQIPEASEFLDIIQTSCDDTDSRPSPVRPPSPAHRGRPSYSPARSRPQTPSRRTRDCLAAVAPVTVGVTGRPQEDQFTAVTAFVRDLPQPAHFPLDPPRRDRTLPTDRQAPQQSRATHPPHRERGSRHAHHIPRRRQSGRSACLSRSHCRSVALSLSLSLPRPK